MEDVNYVLLISTVSGAWRYMIGDTVMITNKELAEIKITGRTKHFLNVVGSQLSVYQMNQALKELGEKYNLEFKEFVVAAIHKDEDYIHKWLLGVDDVSKNLDLQTIALELDNIIKEKNKNYAVARSKALKGVEAEIFPINIFYKWSEEKKNMGGQAKIPRVLKEEEFLEFQEYLKSNL
jgi:hypothetical protein